MCVEREEIDEKETNINGTSEIEVEAEVETFKGQETRGGARKRQDASFADWIIDTDMPLFQMSSCKDSRDKYTCVTK